MSTIHLTTNSVKIVIPNIQRVLYKTSYNFKGLDNFPSLNCHYLEKTENIRKYFLKKLAITVNRIKKNISFADDSITIPKNLNEHLGMYDVDNIDNTENIKNDIDSGDEYEYDLNKDELTDEDISDENINHLLGISNNDSYDSNNSNNSYEQKNNICEDNREFYDWMEMGHNTYFEADLRNIKKQIILNKINQEKIQLEQYKTQCHKRAVMAFEALEHGYTTKSWSFFHTYSNNPYKYEYNDEILFGMNIDFNKSIKCFHLFFNEVLPLIQENM
jgi:hypothetical protein